MRKLIEASDSSHESDHVVPSQPESTAWTIPPTTVPLSDLGTERPEWRGILSPVYGSELIRSFIQQQFLANAAHYAKQYQNTEYWKHLLQLSQRHYQITEQSPLILDIGSGAGNTVFPLLELHPEARIVASDLSAPLLGILKDYLEQHEHGRRCRLMQLNAEELIFEPNQFDLIVGGAILHHLFTPQKTLAESYRVLKPGGVAVFVEPFELGNQVLALIFKQLIDINGHPLRGVGIKAALRRWIQSAWSRHRQLEPAVLQLLHAVCIDTDARKGFDKSAPRFQTMDDKWLFTRTWFEQEGYRAGFRQVHVAAVNPSEDNQAPFTRQTAALLRLVLQEDLQVLPEWARQHLAQADAQFSREIIPELIIEGVVVMQK